MKITMIGQKGIPALYGGIERHVEELSHELVNQGHEVFVYARKWFTSEIKPEYKGVKIIHTPTIKTKHLDAIVHTFASTLHAIFVTKPNIIHYHGVGPSLMTWLPRILSPKTKVVATFHCIDRYHQKWGLFARLMLSLGEKFACIFPHETIAVSKTIQNYCLNEYHANTTYNPNGVIIEKNPGTEYLNEWQIEAGKYLVMVSRLVRHKGAHYLIEGWKMAKLESPEVLKDIKLVIVGGSAFTDDYVNELKEMSEGDSSIIFTDWQSGDKLNSLYANSLMLVHPSENEGLPITVLQGMSFGKPVLVSDIPEHQEVVSDGRFWSANASACSIKNKMLELIQNQELLNDNGIKNLQIVEQEYDWKKITSRTIEIYQKEYSKVKQLQTA